MTKKKTLNRKIKFNYSILALVFIVIGVAVITKASSTYVVQGDEWLAIAKNLESDTILKEAKRGNIYSSDHQLMAVSEDRFRLYIDFWAQENTVENLIKDGMIDSLTKEMQTFLPDSTVRRFRARLNAGIEHWKKYEKAEGKKPKRSRKYPLDIEVNYSQKKRIDSIPYFRAGKYKSGLITDTISTRTNPYGSLAARTIGGIYGKEESNRKTGKSGLEFYYDSLLRGTPGSKTSRLLTGQRLYVTVEQPVDGKDIVSTIDVEIQELAERALLHKLQELNAESGTAIVMEAKTGYVRAIANMGKSSKGEWYERQNYGLSYAMEPGSTFKVVSMMIGLDDGLIRPTDPVDVGNGYYEKHRGIYDHNYRSGGYGLIDAALSIRYSSNIGLVKLIENAYGSNPQRFIDGIDRIGAFQDLQLEIPGYEKPRIRRPDSPMWSAMSLAKMSYGYENTIPPISTLAFYNAIANNGELLKPLFVQEVLSNGKSIEKKEKVVLNPQICKPETLAAIQQMLDDVVNGERGTGKPARSLFVPIAGKTGTAQILLPNGSIDGHQVSFCGYFPVEDPKYSCIVVIRRPRVGSASGGFMAGKVFKQIAEGMYARNLLKTVDILPIDSLRSHEPAIKPSYKEMEVAEGMVPDVKGMGGRDAVYALESAGLRVTVKGRGKVKTQSLPAGGKLKKGEKITIQLES